ncbi:hypothetical protein C5167_049164 [Papaver somniferum]|uniref:Uncharacterized protein n=1 Tax=Papaver somniferum TaxID=3469 RepID=A0A4Y7KK19_PAPSO|nr:hypothetical protein C5167_049164 [Papaver somniferum]
MSWRMKLNMMIDQLELQLNCFGEPTIEKMSLLRIGFVLTVVVSENDVAGSTGDAAFRNRIGFVLTIVVSENNVAGSADDAAFRNSDVVSLRTWKKYMMCNSEIELLIWVADVVI